MEVMVIMVGAKQRDLVQILGGGQSANSCTADDGQAVAAGAGPVP